MTVDFKGIKLVCFVGTISHQKLILRCIFNYILERNLINASFAGGRGLHTKGISEYVCLLAHREDIRSFR